MAVALLIGGLTGVLAPPAVASTPVAEWPQFRGGPARQGSHQPAAVTPANVSTLDVAWYASIGLVVSSPAVVDGVVYVGANGGLYAFPPICSREPSCAPLWTAPAGNGIASSPAVSGGVAYVGSLDHKLYAFDAAGLQGCGGTPKVCAPLWTAETGDLINSSPVVVAGRVYVGSDDDKLYAFDAAGTTNCSGSPKVCAPVWTASTGGDVYSSPAVANGVVYVGSDDGSLHAYDAAGITNCAGTPTTCNSLWTAPTGSPLQTSPAVVNGVVYVGSDALYAYDAAGVTGCAGAPKVCGPLWTAATGPTFASPAVAGGTVYVSGLDRKLSAFDATGTIGCAGIPKVCAPLWTALTTPVVSAIGIATPLVVNGLVFVGTGVGSGFVHAYDAAGVTNCTGSPKSCTPLWSGDAGGAVRSSPAAAGDYLYVGNDGGVRTFGLPVSTDGAFHPTAPFRVLDTRQEGGALAPGETRSLTLAGRVPLPASGVSSVVLNVAVTEPAAGGWLTVHPSGEARPLASSMNFAPGQTLSNAVVAKLGTNGAMDIFNATGSTQVVVDVEGWFGHAGTASGSRYAPLVPARILDTRASSALAPGATLSLPVGGYGGVPADRAVAVVLNVAVTGPTTDGWLTLFASGDARPIASSINFAPGQTVSNKVVVPLGFGWGVDIFNAQGNTHVVVDVEGWFGFPGSAPGVPYHPLTPTRVLDTRATVAVGPDGTLSLTLTGTGGVPATGVTAVVLNVAVTQPTAPAYLTVYPSGETRPLASSINFAAGETISNAVVAKVGPDGSVWIYNPAGTTHVVVDVEGWFGL